VALTSTLNNREMFRNQIEKSLPFGKLIMRKINTSLESAHKYAFQHFSPKEMSSSISINDSPDVKQ
jgi:hypothetical protein